MVPVRRHASNWRAHLARGGLVLTLGWTIRVAAQVPTTSNPPTPSAAVTDQPPQEPAADIKQNPYKDQYGTSGFPFYIKVVPTPKTQKETKEDQDDRDEKTTADWWMVRLTAILAFVSIVQGYIFALQANRLKNTITTMNKIANSQDSALATVNRPYLILFNMSERPILNPVTRATEQWRVEVTLKNVGNTPARRVRGYINSLPCSSRKLPEGFAFFNEANGAYWPDIGSSEIREYEPEDYPVKLWDSYARTEQTLFLYGAVEYSSVFHGRKRFRTEFCVRMDPAGNIRTVAHSAAFTPVGPHNGSDEDCHVKPFVV